MCSAMIPFICPIIRPLRKHENIDTSMTIPILASKLKRFTEPKKKPNLKNSAAPMGAYDSMDAMAEAEVAEAARREAEALAAAALQVDGSGKPKQPYFYRSYYAANNH